MYHWHVEIMPKLTRVAGFEWGTGFYINPTSPEEAAQVLRARASVDLKADPAVWYFGGSGGNNSVVECDLAKVEVAGSNPVSRSNIFFSPGSAGRVARPAIRLLRGAVAKR